MKFKDEIVLHGYREEYYGYGPLQELYVGYMML